MYILCIFYPKFHPKEQAQNNMSSHLLSWLLELILQFFTCVHISNWDDKTSQFCETQRAH